ncbi:uncharacterized protein LOC143177448 [Calliopsis andreniformis]|uniref:uncharacterized protein LOC143177448 n=1 Tax=Calliopsis andreniformis TaxID=337506 RepID=UPI003FCCE859
MSQVCPSSSHQLVAAAIAFRRARRKFPKNYGLYDNPEEPEKYDKAESVSVNEEANDQEDVQFSTRKCTNVRSNRVEGKLVWSDECGESGSTKENLLQKPIICSCCRKRNEAAKANEPMSTFKTRDQCSAGDTLDIVPSKECNEIARKGDPTKSEQLENCEGKTMKSFITESRHSSRCRTSYSHLQRRSPRETSAKLDSVNLLYDRAHDQVDNVKDSGSSEKRNCNTEEHVCNAGEKECKSDHRGSRSKLNFFGSQKDNSSPSILHNCDFHCEKHSTFDLLRPHRDYCRSQSRHRCFHPHNCCHHCYREDYHRCSSKEKPRLSSDTYLCSSNSTGQKCPCKQGHVGNDSLCNHDCCLKDSEKISTVQEQNDEEYDDSIGMINHKDSLCILVEKYKASKKCKHKKYSGAADFSDERAKDECSKSCASEMSCQMEDTVNTKRDKYLDDSCWHRDNRSSIGKSCRRGCGQIFRENDCSQFKNLRSRLVKTGACCSTKGTPWRHTF